MKKTKLVLKKRKLFFIGAMIIVAVACLATVITLKIQNARIVTLTLVHPFENQLWNEALRSEVKEFEKLFPRYRVTPIAGTFGSVQSLVASASKTWDVAIGSSALSNTPSAFAGPLTPFAGSFWGIYYNRAILEKAGLYPTVGAKGLPGILASGNYSIDDFSTACLEVKKTGVVPISLGSQFGWPLAVWIQAFVAGGTSPAEAELMTTEGYDIKSAAFTTAIGRFNALAAAACVDPNHTSKDWPQSIQDVVQGRAAFCLVNEDFISSLLPAVRQNIGYLPLPGSFSADKSSWAIGSLISIGRNGELRENKGSKKLLEFLTSAGTTERLAKRIGAQFFTKGKGPDKIIMSIASKTTNPVIKVIQEQIQK